MNEIKFKGKPIHVTGSFPKMGSIAPSFELVSQDLSTKSLSSFEDKNKILNIFISLDTPVCSKSMHAFNAKASAITDVVIINISMDLPFAASRFCKAENLENVITLSAFRSSFPEDYGVNITDGALKGLTARAVLVLGKDNKVLHSELVSEITQEPDYEAAISSLKSV
ncbi:MAG: thiol peroxidase [Chlamydiota bacterium]